MLDLTQVCTVVPKKICQNILMAVQYERIWLKGQPLVLFYSHCLYRLNIYMGVQWLNGRVLDTRLRGHGFKPHRCHCLVVLEQDTFILA